MVKYPVTLTTDGDTIMAAVTGIPGEHTFGDDEEEALARIPDALETVFMGPMADGEAIPGPPKAKRGQLAIPLCSLSEAKLRLYITMRSQRVGKAELARRLAFAALV